MLPRITRRWFLETGKEGSRPRRRKQVLGPPGGGPGESDNTFKFGSAGNLAPLFDSLYLPSGPTDGLRRWRPREGNKAMIKVA